MLISEVAEQIILLNKELAQAVLKLCQGTPGFNNLMLCGYLLPCIEKLSHRDRHKVYERVCGGAYDFCKAKTER